MQFNRRDFCRTAIAAGSSLIPAASLCAADAQQPADNKKFKLNYIVASCMYGKLPLAQIVPEVPKSHATHLEIWATPHGNQREQLDEMGEEKFIDLLNEHQVKLGSFTCFKYGIFKMQPEMKLVKRLGGDMVICNTGGPKNLEGSELKTEVNKFAEKMKPHIAAAEEIGVTIGVENHSGGLIASPDSIRMLFDLVDSPSIGLAMAPYHLPQEPELIGGLIEELGPRLVHFQAWEHGMGCTKKLPKEQELMQLPHRGPLDWKPILASLKRINYQGRTEIFMHPVPRGIPILPKLEDVTKEINASRESLESLIA
ncbi:sugar phosphate isomerase/epimerase family protein [Thalassoglobus sp.]|uniref:sugar phosphate isomerase/epimerase family protein n=1 Tax=Thalassoglobus sp. TaxID=2795869 RepID=UPI003AA94C36